MREFLDEKEAFLRLLHRSRSEMATPPLPSLAMTAVEERSGLEEERLFFAGGAWHEEDMWDNTYYVYMMTNQARKVIYTGMTGNLKRRIYEHKNKIYPGFTKKYNIDRLVYVEMFEHPSDAITRETQIKKGSRADKITLIERMNKDWKDLWGSLIRD